ncbi:hypothetical protein NQ315_007381 [Exocentrus adspersus]|uniref:Uncharacterized protein n=1 Tax=Exocentrus adspersus TaxID=1586481 RepID=A0AAV8VHF6_9CUCU|nr:hypothetical protein NQ315_007381 [Exocentrus adspersus]
MRGIRKLNYHDHKDHDHKNRKHHDESRGQKWAGRVMDGVHGGELMQTRFKRIPDSHLNAETVAGIRDMNLGRIRNGIPIGAPTIRFDTGRNSGANPHINIDPLGRPNARNPHIEVPSGVISSAQVINRTLKYAGITFRAAAVVIDGWRIFSAVQDDCYIHEHADEIIWELKDSIRKLEKLYKAESSSRRKEEIRETIHNLKEVLRDVKRTRKVPVKTIRTVSSVGGGWSGGLAGGAGGAWAGAKAGTAVGAIFGPAGAVVGAPVGAVLGAIGGGISASILGSAAGEAVADQALRFAD